VNSWYAETAQVPRFYVPAGPAPSDETTVEVPTYPVDSLRWKRAIDVAVSVIGLVLTAPLLLVVAATIKLTSRGPVLFKQERIGLNRRCLERRQPRATLGRGDRRGRDRRVLINYGRPFTMYKFRTMVADAESGKPKWAEKSDPRITRVGRIMRKTRIDEIPQFVNVLRGEMSIVGPRPERAYFIAETEKDLPEFQTRLRAKPGLTGLAQVNVGYTNSLKGMAAKLYYDLRYINSLSVQTDLRILARTVLVVLTGRGAF
jgi:lipopolysaccharide/colanic/teichoic acid biosynthesis glycosyltransferase